MIIVHKKGLPQYAYHVTRYIEHAGRLQFYAVAEIHGELFDIQFLSEPYESEEHFLRGAIPFTEKALKNRQSVEEALEKGGAT